MSYEQLFEYSMVVAKGLEALEGTFGVEMLGLGFQVWSLGFMV